MNASVSMSGKKKSGSLSKSPRKVKITSVVDIIGIGEKKLLKVYRNRALNNNGKYRIKISSSIS
jgi:hypothetical protein